MYCLFQQSTGFRQWKKEESSMPKFAFILIVRGIRVSPDIRGWPCFIFLCADVGRSSLAFTIDHLHLWISSFEHGLPVNQPVYYLFYFLHYRPGALCFPLVRLFPAIGAFATYFSLYLLLCVFINCIFYI